MRTTIAAANHKGGVIKTTATFHLSGVYAQKGASVLCVDLDPQGSLTKAFGFRKGSVKPSVADLLLNPEVRFTDVVHPTPIERIYLVPATLELRSAQKKLENMPDRAHALRTALERLSLPFDYILIDCPPALDLLNTNGLVAADGVFIPVESSTTSLDVLPEFLSTVRTVQQDSSLNPNLKILGMALTKHQAHTTHGQQVHQALRNLYPSLLLETVVPLSVEAKDSYAAGRPISIYNPRSSMAEIFTRLADELHLRAMPVQEATLHAQQA